MATLVSRLLTPTISGEWVIWYTCQPTATVVSALPNRDTNLPTYRRRKSRLSRSGVMSTAILLSRKRRAGA